MNQYSTQPQMLFQCDHQLVHSMKKHRESAHSAMKNVVNRKVRVHTMDDEAIEGIVINVDAKNVYILVEQGNRGFYPGYPPFVPYDHVSLGVAPDPVCRAARDLARL